VIRALLVAVAIFFAGLLLVWAASNLLHPVA